MNYIKTYENYKKLYNKNDYVVLKKPLLDAFLLPYAKIIRKINYKKGETITRYYVEILYPNTEHWAYSKYDEQHTCTIEDYLISDRISKKEMEEIKLNIEQSKYNL
jgi:hypothetical protein